MRNVSRLRDHLTLVHGKKYTDCYLCGDSPEQLKRHLYDTHNIGVEEKTPANLKTKSRINVSDRLNTAKYVLHCAVCYRLAETKESLATHSEERCKFCHVKLSSQKKNHIELHDDDYKCIYCFHIFESVRQLYRHKAMHVCN